MFCLLGISFAVSRAAFPVAGADYQHGNKSDEKDNSKLFHTVLIISFTKINFSP
jgi:hypothetical protein